MATLNAVLRALIDPVMSPLAGLPAVIGVFLWSIPVGVMALLLFKWTSNQARIAEIKRRIQAGLFEIRLFNDDLRAILRAQGEVLGQVVLYQGHALRPMLFILPPLLLIMVQLHAFYGFRGLRPGESVLVRVELADDGGGRSAEVTLHLPPGLRAETPAVRVPTLGEVNWRLAADDWGDFELRLEVAGSEVTKRIRVTDRLVRLAPVRPDGSFLEQLEWPSESPLPKGPVRAIHVDYPDGPIGLGGFSAEWRYAWMVVFFVLTMVIAVALKGPLGVEL